MSQELNTSTRPQRRIQRVRHELKRRELTVTAVERLSPHYVAITFHGESLADFASDSFDDHLKFMVDTGADEPARRDYTPRRFDRAARELVIEFALHGSGAASDWASQVQVGQQALIGGPRGSMIVPTDYEWHLLAGDDTALPAIARRLEELPAGARALVLGLVADDADRRVFTSAADVLQVQWHRTGDDWLAALRALQLPAGEGFVWCAGEARLMAQARDVLLQHHQHPREAMRVAAYWKQGATDFHHETLEGGVER